MLVDESPSAGDQVPQLDGVDVNLQLDEQRNIEFDFCCDRRWLSMLDSLIDYDFGEVSEALLIDCSASTTSTAVLSTCASTM